jgi:hypothetical protein
MGSRTINVSVFARINVAIGVMVFSLAPIIFVAGRIRARAMEVDNWVVLVAILACLQFLLFLAQRRCSSEAMPFWQGVLVVSASMRTGLLYTDVLLAVLAVPFTLLASLLFLTSKNPAYQFHKLVYRFYENRMQQ